MKNKFILLNLFSLFVSFSLLGQQGSLDNSFSGDGKVTTTFTSFSNDAAQGIAQQSDGKIVVAGVGNGMFGLVRYNINGTVDNTFGSAGKVTTAIGSAFNDWGYSIAIQPDGKIIVAGSSDNGSDLDFAVARYNTNGSLDNTFSGDGKLTTAIGTDDDVAQSVALQSDGKVVVAGYSYDASFNYKFTVARYNTNGTLDNTFDTDGKLMTPNVGTSSSSKDVAHKVLIQSDGKIIVAGHSINTSTSDFAVVRYNTDGSLDPTFSFDGKLTLSFVSGNDGAYAAALQDDGKLVVGGYSYTGPYNFALCRLNTDGSSDYTFGSAGKVTSAFTQYDEIHGIAIQDNGKIVVAGQTHTGTSIYNNFAVLRYNSDGTPDNSFDTDGYVTTSFGTVDDIINDVAIQSDGKIIAAGYYNNGSDNDFAVARYISDPAAVPPPCTVTIYDTITTHVSDTTFLTVTDTNFVTVYDTVAAYVDTMTVYVSVTDTLFIHAVLTGVAPPNNSNDLKIYPNPASDHIYIDNGNFSSMNGYQIIIENALSQQVFVSLINQPSFYIDLSTWNGNGIYFVRIIDASSNIILTKKIVIQ